MQVHPRFGALRITVHQGNVDDMVPIALSSAKADEERGLKPDGVYISMGPPSDILVARSQTIGDLSKTLSQGNAQQKVEVFSWLREKLPDFLARLDTRKSDSQPLFPDHKGMLTAGEYYDAYRDKIAEAAKIGTWRPFYGYAVMDLPGDHPVVQAKTQTEKEMRKNHLLEVLADLEKRIAHIKAQLAELAN